MMVAPKLTKAVLPALLALTAAPAFAQIADLEPPQAPPEAAAPAPEAATEAPPAAREMTKAEIAAFNKAVDAFTAGQALQQKGDNAGAVAKYDAALPAIRTAVEADPAAVDNVTFLANALYADAAAYGAMGQMDKVVPLYEEALPHWRKVVDGKPEDATSRNILAGILVQVGNSKLAVQDRGGADPYYAEALTLARKSVEESPQDAVSRNLLLSALIGAGQTSTQEGMLEEALTMGKAMIADGSIDAVNRPTVEQMVGAAG
jgi:tetratricopeptide (TPR) repeat protein